MSWRQVLSWNVEGGGYLLKISQPAQAGSALHLDFDIQEHVQTFDGVPVAGMMGFTSNYERMWFPAKDNAVQFLNELKEDLLTIPNLTILGWGVIEGKDDVLEDTNIHFTPTSKKEDLTSLLSN